MFKVHDLPQRKLESYRGITRAGEIDRIRKKADELAGNSVIHVNSTRFGGGVAEILSCLVPLMKDVGLNPEWWVLEGDDEFFRITKSIHNALQGDRSIELKESDMEHYVEVNRRNSTQLPKDAGFVVVHDPQPAALIEFVEKHQPWIWRCHIDMSDPNPTCWEFISRFVKKYDGYVFHLEEYVQSDLDTNSVFTMPPSIDPLSDKNIDLSDTEVLKVLERFDVDPEKPKLVQVSRFDPWKGIFDTINVYRIVKKKIPDVQLLLVGVMAGDDPEGWVYYEKVLRHVGEDYDIKILTNLIGVNAREVNAFQRAADVVLQMSIREGFGLTVAEAMWKEKAVVGRAVGGIKKQIIDGRTGFLVRDAGEASEKALYLLRHKDVSMKLGRNAKERVLDEFVITRHLERYLDMLRNIGS